MASDVRGTLPRIVSHATLLREALELLEADQGELDKLLGPSKAWPLPAEKTGWILSHNAIRFDMDNIVTVIEKTLALVKLGRGLDGWQATTFQAIVADFRKHVRKHHDNEEEIFFPMMEKRVKLPSRVSDEHPALMQLLDGAHSVCNAMKPSDAASAKPVLEELLANFSQLRSLMRQHLEEEEMLVLPLLRKHFTSQEFQQTEKKIVAGMKPHDLAWLLRSMTLKEKHAAMTLIGVPFLVQRLVMLPAIRKDEATLVQAYRDLAAGEQAVGQAGGHQQPGPGPLCCFLSAKVQPEETCK